MLLEMDTLHENLKTKEAKIESLTDELNFVKEERNENIFQVQSILKDFDLLAKAPYNSVQSGSKTNININIPPVNTGMKVNLL
jgi:hypothetical protein